MELPATMESIAAPGLRRLAARDDDAGHELLQLLKDPFLQGKLAPASLYSAVATSLGFTAFISICFSLLRPYNQAIYAPKLKHADEKHAPPPIGKKPWSWVTPLFKTDEIALMHQIGMDATIFLRFMRMCRNLFLVLALVGVGILLPVNLAKSVKRYGNGPTTEWTIQITPRDVYGEPQWAQVVVAWVFNLVIMAFLYFNYAKVLQLRRQYFETPDYQHSLHSRTLMLYDLPRQSRSDEGIARIIDRVVPSSSFARTAVARNVKDLPDLIDEHGHAVRKLEKILARYLRDPERLPATRPQCKPSKRDRARDTYPKGQRLDSIDYYTQRIRDLEIEIKEVRAAVDRRGTMPYGFASYADIAEAHSIAHACAGKRSKTQGATVTLAPRPADIIWRNMPLSRATRSRRRWINNFWIAILTLLWVGPNAMIAIFLVNLSNLGKVWPAFKRSMDANTVFWGMVQGILSPSLMSLVYLVLPMIFRRLSVQAGDQTKTGRERHVMAKMYSFFIFNNLVVFSFFSTVWTFISAVVETTSKGTDAWEAMRTAKIADAIFLALCNNSVFWVTYLLQRQLGAAIDLAQIWPLIQAFCLKKFSSPTPRELIELTAPPPFEYASYYNYFLFYSTVTLCFAGIQPLVLIATAMYFTLDSYLKKYLLLYRFVTKTESGGLFWRVLFNRLVLAAVLSDLVVMLTCWVRGVGTLLQFYACIPLPFVMVAFKMYCRRAFDVKIRYYSTQSPAGMREAALQQHKEHRLRSEKLSSRFGHPALYQPLITPMVHSRAQNLLPSVYRGRLTDGRDANGGGGGIGSDLVSVSGYSDMYALDAMQQGGKPGKSAASANSNRLPGFEYVSEAHMDFEYYKNRAEFTEHHGGGDMYGRPGTPASTTMDDLASDRSASPQPGGGRSSTTPPTPFTPGITPRRVASDTSYAGGHEYMATRSGGPGPGPGPGPGRHISPLYSHDNGSSSGLVRHAAGVPVSPPGHLWEGGSGSGSGSGGGGGGGSAAMSMMNRSSPGLASGPTSPPPPPAAGPGPSVGALGGGPRGYSGLAQFEDVEGGGDGDAARYAYFRSGNRPIRRPGEGW